MEMTAFDALMADYSAFVEFNMARDRYLDEVKVVNAVEDAYWTDMEALELGAEKDAYYKRTMH